MSRILIIGGHGKIALLLAPLLVERGDDVSSVIRNPDHAADVAATGATPIVADVEQLDEAGLADVIAGHDTVIWSAGAGGGSPERTYAVDRDAAIRSMDAAATAGARRYVMVSYFGAGRDHGVPPENPFFAYAEAKAAADEHLEATALEWTILAPSTLTLDPPTGRIDVAALESGSVGRADVALVIAAALNTSATVGRTIRFNSGDVSIADALA
ncbi:MAG: SDR family oxidoreductase [Microbacterium sp.]